MEARRGSTETRPRDRRDLRTAGVALAAAALLALPAAPGGTAGLAAQQDALPLTPEGLLRAGLRVEPDDSERNNGFEIFDARLGVGGSVGIVFDFGVLGEFDPEDESFRLLDARLTVPVLPEARLSFGQFKAPFGREALTPLGRITFLQRASASRAIAPFRNVGVEVWGETLEQRLTYRAGVFNGNGRALENDNGHFLWAGRVEYNSIGPIEFYEDLVVQVGASLAVSADSAAALGTGLDGRVGVVPVGPVDFASFRGDRVLWGGDFHLSYRGFRLDGEYLRADLEADVASGPAPGPSELDLEAHGWYLEGAYAAWGALETVARWDAFAPALGPDRDFLILGVNAYPGYYAKVGFQYAFGLGDSPASAELADGQFVFYGQLSY